MDASIAQDFFGYLIEIAKVFVLLVIVLIFLYIMRDKIPNFFKAIKRVKLYGVDVEFHDLLKNEARLYSDNLLNLPSDGEMSSIIEISKISKKGNIDFEKIIRELSTEYELIRVSLDKSKKRTALMDEKAVGMRLLGMLTVSIREKLALSSSPGERLAAIMSLQVSPSPFYLEWLYSCICEERAFLKYHALLALRSSIKNLPRKNLKIIEAVLEKIRFNLRNRWPIGSDRIELFDEIYGIFLDEKAKAGI